ncbi:hypothetical protein BDW02DRAFT_222013 [Decorospora gaudefroyi]|uniref:Uncharacterized protein n=1 Tax=Decorospora gaudefroyi TaxID=184978 RepID=A0A6A5KLH3_9PLEO|nr:hypothetical protein BDW02DRAFT_222013 [Decorospora gaudefroyi]
MIPSQHTCPNSICVNGYRSLPHAYRPSEAFLTLWARYVVSPESLLPQRCREPKTNTRTTFLLTSLRDRSAPLRLHHWSRCCCASGFSLQRNHHYLDMDQVRMKRSRIYYTTERSILSRQIVRDDDDRTPHIRCRSVLELSAMVWNHTYIGVSRPERFESRPA